MFQTTNQSYCPIKIAIDSWNIVESLLFGFQIEDEVIEVLNFICLTAKNYIYTEKIFHNNNICFYAFLSILKSKLEKTCLILDSKGEKFRKYDFVLELL